MTFVTIDPDLVRPPAPSRSEAAIERLHQSCRDTQARILVMPHAQDFRFRKGTVRGWEWECEVGGDGTQGGCTLGDMPYDLADLLLDAEKVLISLRPPAAPVMGREERRRLDAIEQVKARIRATPYVYGFVCELQPTKDLVATCWQWRCEVGPGRTQCGGAGSGNSADDMLRLLLNAEKCLRDMSAVTGRGTSPVVNVTAIKGSADQVAKEISAAFARMEQKQRKGAM